MNSALLEQAGAFVSGELAGARPCCGIVLGSGWKAVADVFEPLRAVDYARIPGLGAAQVAGHDGRLVLGRRAGREALLFIGRRHWYEGAGWEPVAIPIAVLRALGAPVVFLTNSAGGVRPGLQPGDLLLIEDHLNAMGVNPLTGPPLPGWGPRFPDVSQAYDPALTALLEDAGRRLGIPLQRGVYAAVAGPSYETPAEVRALRLMGADAVGMSTVPEVLLARAGGLRVAALSCITNPAAGLGAAALRHEDVLAVSGRAARQGAAVLAEVVARLPERQAPEEPT